MKVRARRPLLPAILLTGLLAIAGCQPAARSSPAPSPVAATGTAVASPRPTPSPTDPLVTAPDARPPWVADLEGQLDCDGPMSSLGQEVPDEVEPFDPAPTPQ